jgi:hypothetical protein
LIPFARTRRIRISDRAENAVPSAGAILGRSLLSPQKDSRWVSAESSFSRAFGERGLRRDPPTKLATESEHVL